MKTLDKVFTEEQAIGVADKILSTTLTKFTEELTGVFYRETEAHLHQIYDNEKKRIETDLIAEITEEFVKDPMQYRFEKLRRKIFEENKDELTKTLTDAAIQNSVSNVIQEYTHADYMFSWKWKDGIAKILIENADKFLSDERVNTAHLRTIRNQETYIQSLKDRLSQYE